MVLLGDLISMYQRNILDSKDLNEWAYSLLELGKESETILIAASCADIYWEEVLKYFKTILGELKITDDLDSNIENIKQEIILEEYNNGLRSGGNLLHENDNLRKEICFPDMIGLTIIGDDYNGNDKPGYHTLDRRLYGDELEKEIKKYLIKTNKI
jgi:hypothetical protein